MSSLKVVKKSKILKIRYERIRETARRRAEYWQRLQHASASATWKISDHLSISACEHHGNIDPFSAQVLPPSRACSRARRSVARAQDERVPSPSMLPTASRRLYQLGHHLNLSPVVAASSSNLSFIRKMATTAVTMPESSAAVTPLPPLPVLNFDVSPIPKNPLGEGRWIKTAGCLIIG